MEVQVGMNKCMGIDVENEVKVIWVEIVVVKVRVLEGFCLFYENLYLYDEDLIFIVFDFVEDFVGKNGREQ